MLDARQVIRDADGTRAQAAQCRPGEQRPRGYWGAVAVKRRWADRRKRDKVTKFR